MMKMLIMSLKKSIPYGLENFNQSEAIEKTIPYGLENFKLSEARKFHTRGTQFQTTLFQYTTNDCDQNDFGTSMLISQNLDIVHIYTPYSFLSRPINRLAVQLDFPSHCSAYVTFFLLFYTFV